MRFRATLRTPKTSAFSAFVLALIGGAIALPGTALGAPEYATPDPGSPAGTEYGLPLTQGRGAGGGGGGGDGIGGVGGPVGSGHNGGSGGPGGGATAGGTGGPGGTTAAAASELFGAGITPAHGSGSSGSSSGGARGAGGGGRNADESARGVSDVDLASARASTADGQVALIVVMLLGGAIALAVVLRLVARRSPTAGPA